MAIFLLTDTLVAFDHAFGRLLLIANVYPGEDGEAQARAEAEARLDADRSAGCWPPLPAAIRRRGPPGIRPNCART